MLISCIHQGYELYGSDRCFAETVAIIRDEYPTAEIEVVLPRDGPLVELIEANATRVCFEPIWVLRRKNLFQLATIGLLNFPTAVAKAISRMRRSDLVYINTSVVADYIFVSRFFRRSTLLHIHEIPEGIALRFLRALVAWSRVQIIFNSNATKAAFALPRHTNSTVIYNGVVGPASPQPSNYVGQRKMRLLMLGRINRIKGQEILIEAVRLLPQSIRSKITVRMVGGAFEDRLLENLMHSLVETGALSDVIKIEPFTIETADLYLWADVVIVPSKRPESLGRVAIEAMSFARPPIASAIGGLIEVVDDGVAGWLVPPNRADMLATTLERIVEHPENWLEFGPRARTRYDLLFSNRSVSDAIKVVLREKLSVKKQPEGADASLPVFPDAS